MSEPFLSEIKIFGFNFAPRGWAQCDGQILPINQNQSLYSLLGTTYGGDGRTSFALPDMRGRVPLHANGGQYSFGQKAGAESVTLTGAEIPSHSHAVNGTSENGDTNTFTGNSLAAGFDSRTVKQKAAEVYAPAANLINLHSSTVASTGGSLPHNNLQPSCVVNFCIALQGLFPSRT
jgi:microcystin-dependent protein